MQSLKISVQLLKTLLEKKFQQRLLSKTVVDFQDYWNYCTKFLHLQKASRFCRSRSPVKLGVVDGEPKLSFIPIPGSYTAELFNGPGELLTSIPIDAVPEVTVRQPSEVPVPLETLGIDNPKTVLF